ncbi:pre-mRNA splicing factor [Yamadazyma tenuis]|uniref:Pre-mRNA-processing factor 39 n=1 Tax=Candida tenuis (strain ATCC 10573 / BCRC 21748 / CBS 615 / JCM 9827 / NBRC 10315 / NRRL Y-1498 / VKM Y-70) TaxID=590646 RepID=G3BCC5_CANTC|nr:uncharacterized protein CANTEDRAFT_111520 [Yamadazyma tenuis ATCC 10573]EGV60803.1 hypothetical protein CANTEDRAFT_111520 [Yamadazyma tenuis ATCC 10573]WEJ93930.1 pre-mRNA splicing factor [Yamadazyma tenuis]
MNGHSILPVDRHPSTPAKGPEEFERLKTEVDTSPNNIHKWDELFAKIDDRINSVNPKDVSAEFKSFIHTCYTELLDRLPFLVEHWRRFSIIEYKLNGIKSSIEVLSRSVDAVQFSVGLWEDYLNALALEKDEKYGHALEMCISLNGHHFNSHNIWDKYLEHKKDNVLPVYLKLIHIPLYEYAKYYNQFAEINKNYSLKDILGDDLEENLQRFGKTSPDECSVIESHQIIDEFSYQIFATNQTRVNAKWEFESKITTLDLNLKVSSDTESDNWFAYLDYEIQHYKQDYNTITNLFERALIPNCFNQKLWLKYLAYINVSDESHKFQVMDSIYSRCVNKFIPLDVNFVRFSYGRFLLKHNKVDLMNDYLLDLVKFFGGDNNSKLYLKSGYTETVESLLVNWSKLVGTEAFLQISQSLLECYFEESKSITAEVETVSRSTVNLLFSRLNDQSILVVIKLYLNTLLSVSDLSNPKDVNGLRQFFNKHYKRPQLRSSVSFWKFYVELEGAGMFNFSHLHQIIKYIQKETTLSKIVVNKFLNFQYNLYTSNYKRFKADVDDDSIIRYQNNLSLNPTDNKYLLASYGKSIRDIKDQFEHPGIVIDNKPDITNKLMNQNFDLFSDEFPYPATFKNIEKANAPIPFPQ